MSSTNSGMFSVREFNYRRNVLRIAPDAFITISDALNTRVISPVESGGYKNTDTRGGITSINVSCAVSPAGANRATIEVIAPQYKGLHDDYYTTLPNGARVPIFTPMMEIKVYMKGRYLEQEYNYAPRYYPVFWGMIVGIQENYNAGVSTISLTCEDLLSWWKYQKVTLQSSVVTMYYGGAHLDRFPSTFVSMSPWEIILALFSDTFFMQRDKETGKIAHYNMVYPQWSNIYQAPTTRNLQETWSSFSQNVVDYWNVRFGYGVTDSKDPAQYAASLIQSIPLEMYGMKGAVSTATIAERIQAHLDPDRESLVYQANSLTSAPLDYGMLANVLPYGLFDLYGDGAEPQILSKLEIASAVCEKVNMEFFVDTSGSFVFKPPLYNLDVATGDIPYYRIGPEEIVNFNAGFDSSAVLNYLVVTGPLLQALKMEAIGLHADFDSIKKYGIRSETVSVPYGMNGDQLKMIAVAEMGRRNGQAYTGSLSMPLRPEMRLGYPVYLPHVDMFYYVTGINHSYAYGSSATTDLTLQFRRERIFEDGTTGLINSNEGDVLTGCVFRERLTDIGKIVTDNAAATTKTEISKVVDASTFKHLGLDPNDKNCQKNLEKLLNEAKEQQHKKLNRTYSGPDILGYWRISKAEVKSTATTITNPDNSTATVSNELLMITDKTVPYTDKNGYRHIGAFPYGANLVVMKNGTTIDATNAVQVGAMQTMIQVDATGTPSTPSSTQSTTADQSVPGATSTEGAPRFDQPVELTQEQYTADYKASYQNNPGPVNVPTRPATTDEMSNDEITKLLNSGPESIAPAYNASLKFSSPTQQQITM